MEIKNAPKGSFLGQLIGGEGEVRPFPLGSRFLLVEDATRADKIVPMFLAGVSLKKLTFRCDCGQPACTRVMEYNLKVKGQHPSRMYAQGT